MKEYLKINPADNVVVALKPLSAGTIIDVDSEQITLSCDVPQGHKCALKDFEKGENVIKYGFPIGHTICHVPKGSLICHDHIATNLEGTLEYTHIRLLGLQKPSPSGEPLTFMGYPRPDGQVCSRNEIWVIPTVGCVNGVIKQIVEQTQRELGALPEGIDGIFHFPHNYGCSQLSQDHENTKKILRDMVHHPNAGGVLVVGLGCENNQPRVFEQFCGNYDKNRVKFMICQETDGDEVQHGVCLLKQLIANAQSFRRLPMPASCLRIGLKCGGSDGLSGITANPLLGAFSDFLCQEQGGATILTEVPEMFGAETILMQRCANNDLLRSTINLINDFKRYFISHGEPCGENPSPGNKQGGISTLEEKALGCTQKSGTSAVCGVLDYGDRIQSAGLNLLSAPGNDLVASTALAAAGCQMVLFTTGRGTPFGTFVPTIKVSTNTTLATRKPAWIDFNAGTLVENQTMPQVLAQFIAKVLAVASGEKTTNELSNTHEIAIFKTGVTL